jgi:hypothetical protein
MSTQTVIQDQPRSSSECWCCGTIEDPAQLVHLGNHPEVTVCTRCAHSVSKWAWEIEDQSRTGLAVRGRNQFRRLRKTVVQHGWHRGRLVGRPLRWLGKHTP